MKPEQMEKIGRGENHLTLKPSGCRIRGTSASLLFSSAAHLCSTKYVIMSAEGRNDNGTNHQVYLEKAALWRFLSSQYL